VNDPSLQKWCGCYLPDAQYSRYTDVYRISKECTPSCNLKGVIPLPTSDGIGVKTCQQSTCVIDDISIELFSTNVQDFSFTQMCSGCSGVGNICSCTLADTTMKIIDGKLPNLSLTQNCGSGSTCYKEGKDSEGNDQKLRVPCSSDESYDPYEALNKENVKRYYKSINRRNIRVLLMIVVSLLIVMILYFILHPPNRDDKISIVGGKPGNYQGVKRSGFKSILDNGLNKVKGYKRNPASKSLPSLLDRV
jgi:hypothetical protein